nr:hypothetical protein [Brevibacillus laterosporus]
MLVWGDPDRKSARTLRKRKLKQQWSKHRVSLKDKAKKYYEMKKSSKSLYWKRISCKYFLNQKERAK